MLRRDPTRIELTLDEVQVYLQRRSELEAERAKAATDQDGAGQFAGTGGAAAATAQAKPKARIEEIHERIGFDPAPRVT